MSRNTPVEKLRIIIEQHGLDILRVSLGVVFFWFGFLKFFGETSAAEEIASRTISAITFETIGSAISMPLLAVIECVIGLGLLFQKAMRFVIPLLYFQMAGTVLPLFIFTDDTWSAAFVPTLLGQYILKNCILISAAIVLGVASKGGELIADPEVAQPAKEIEKKRVDEELE